MATPSHTIVKVIPGNDGLPVVGEALDFSRNPYQFIEDRVKQYGPVFRTNLLGYKLVFMNGAEAWEFFSNPTYVSREDAVLPFLAKVFGGKNMGQMDGPQHKALRQLVGQGLNREALTSYLPEMQQLIETALQNWSQKRVLACIEELKLLAIQTICRNIAGLKPGPRLDALKKDYVILVDGISKLPIPVPGTPYSNALKALDRILAVYDEVIQEHRREPGNDGLSRILSAGLPDGRKISDAEVRLELHHMVIAGFIVFGILAAILIQLDKHPAVREKLWQEIRQVAPDGPLTLEQLAGMEYLNRVVMETKRLTPILPIVEGIATRTFDYKGHNIPATTRLVLPLHLTNLDPEHHRNPQEFDPDRFGPERAEDKQYQYAFAPQSAGPHQCAGMDYSTIFTMVFTVTLLRAYSWSLPEQDLNYIGNKVVPEPKDSLRIRLETKVSDKVSQLLT
jgi:cytochrome P450